MQQNTQDEISECCFDEPVSSAMDSQCNDCDSDGGSSVASLSDGEADLPSERISGESIPLTEIMDFLQKNLS